MIVLVPRQRQAEPLHRVGDEASRPVVVDAVEGLDDRRQIVTAEVVHQLGQFVVRPRLDQLRHRPLVADLLHEALSPRRAALEHQCRVERVRAAIDPLPQYVTSRFAERRLLQRAIFEDHHVPAEVLEELLVALPKTFTHDRIEALPVIIDDPPAIAEPLLPALQHRLEDVALIELGVADQRDHAAFRPIETPAVRPHVVLGQR